MVVRILRKQHRSLWMRCLLCFFFSGNGINNGINGWWKSVQSAKRYSERQLRRSKGNAENSLRNLDDFAICRKKEQSYANPRGNDKSNRESALGRPRQFDRSTFTKQRKTTRSIPISIRTKRTRMKARTERCIL